MMEPVKVSPMVMHNRFEKKPVEGADVLAQWQAEWQARTRAEIVADIGDALTAALRKVGYQAVADKSVEEPALKAKPTPTPRKRKRRKRAGVKTGPRPGSNTYAVLQAIKANPGKRGVDVWNAINTTGVEINERTMRTALRRLKRNYIEQRNGAWYPVKNEEEKKTAQ